MDVFRHFNPRSPRGERLTVLNPNVCIIGFQSTLSARRATEASIMFNARDFDFNPRSPRGERRCRGVVAFLSNGFQSTLSARRATLFKFFEVFKMFISIHALREESDQILENVILVVLISIHALREESDAGRLKSVSTCSNFNPRSPRGERPQCVTSAHLSIVFQSTLSARRATPQILSFYPILLFQSTLSARRATIYCT